ncbi:protein ABHD11-like isoform X1 [Schistocerca piceifrons]|uniref:protein ABHD11-like isoform X1 n=1 Tax=Schistocerca piceifrons TaxID=274613 RepID=UPI001F5F3C54|nr:protein ABHD11-like isoform X1 [Schistocerca piceifrons]
MGMGSVFTRYAGLRCLFIQNTLGVNAYRHIENAINYNSRNKTLYREQSTSVRLAYSIYSKEGRSSGSPVLIVHGLMGSRMNWNSVSKAIVSKINRNVIAIDARNHGDSAHSPDMTYGHMVEDLRLFVDELKLGRVCPIGHSMGGKVVMLFALTHPELVEKLVVVDVSPRRVSPSFTTVKKYLEAMQQIEFGKSMSLSAARKLIEQKLSPIVKVPAVCQFLAMNVTQAENGEMKWKVNLDTLVDTFDEISSFPATEKVFEGPTYFIGGGDSDYIRKEDEQEIKKIFPSATFKYIPGAGHWVHADKPNEFVEEVCRFLTGN